METLKNDAPKTLSLAAEVDGAADSSERLPARIDRYSMAKKTAVGMGEYIRSLDTGRGFGGSFNLRGLARRLGSCANYLVFRHYFTVDKVRLAGASFCGLHLLCAMCAIRRGAKALKAYLARYELVIESHPELKPYLVTLTVRDGEDIWERFAHLKRNMQRLGHSRHLGRGSAWECVRGAVWSYEFKRGRGSGLWHPHVHIIALSDSMPDQAALSAQWLHYTGDSFIVDVREMTGEIAAGFCEVFKYAVKFSDMQPQDTLEAHLTLQGSRLMGSSGLLFGVVVPESLADDLLDDLPYIELFYNFVNGAGFTLRRTLAEFRAAS